MTEIEETAANLSDAARHAIRLARPGRDFWIADPLVRRQFLSDWLVTVRRPNALRLSDKGVAVRALLNEGGKADNESEPIPTTNQNPIG